MGFISGTTENLVRVSQTLDKAALFS